MGLAARARRLLLARAWRPPGELPARGLIWSAPEPGGEVDRDSLAPGARVVADHTMVVYGEEPNFGESTFRERVAVDDDDRGRIFAWNGALVGRVRTRGKGVLMDISWPEGLPARDPAAAVSAGVVSDADRILMQSRRRADEDRVAAELADARAAERR